MTFEELQQQLKATCDAFSGDIRATFQRGLAAGLDPGAVIAATVAAVCGISIDASLEHEARAPAAEKPAKTKPRLPRRNATGDPLH